MLPEYAQGRKAIWNAINPHTQRRRIDEAFPIEARENTNEQEMFIRFKSGATWQVVGSDRYDSTVGSPPAGVTFSEWAISNPAAWAYIAPILVENNGWAAFITTSRGRNHAKTMLDMARKSVTWFSEVLTVDDTGLISPEVIEAQRIEYHSLYGEEGGNALIEQEYYCSFDAAILGSYYGKELRDLEKNCRLLPIEYDESVPVNTAWDLGYRDDTAIWWYQIVRGEVHILDFHSSSTKDPDFYFDLVKAKPYKYGIHWLPHDAKAKTLAAKGKSIQEMWWEAFGIQHVRIVPEIGIQSGVQAVRRMFPRTYFDIKTEPGIEALRQYRRKWDDEKKTFAEQPFHDWTSHPADAFRMLGVAWAEEIKPVEKAKPTGMTIAEMIEATAKKRKMRW